MGCREDCLDWAARKIVSRKKARKQEKWERGQQQYAAFILKAEEETTCTASGVLN